MHVKQPGLYFSHPACLEHDPRAYMPEHPDTPERLLGIEQTLAREGWLDWERREAPPASETQLQLVHSARHIEGIKELAIAGGGAIDPDTFVGEPSYRAALHAAGGACEMTRTLVEGEASVGFCGVRPSGHHAEPDRAMGFCLFNNFAIATEFAVCELDVKRVFILNWDVHHGNGTAEAFRCRPDVLFASIHRSGIYPGRGPSSDVGSGPGEGYTINLPVPGSSEEELWLSLIEHIMLPPPSSSSRSWSCSRPASIPIRQTHWRAVVYRAPPLRRWPGTSGTSPMSSACLSGRSWRAAMNAPHLQNACGRHWRRSVGASRRTRLRRRRC
jgi:acetoin utilization deacetylase AcuC-like enzyme